MMTTTLAEKAERFAALHKQDSLFVMPNAWDEGSAKMLAAAGFPALGTTSGGVNWCRGRADYVYEVPAEEMLQVYGQIAASVDLPVSGDLENGYGDEPEKVAETITRSAELGIIGGSIEDFTGDYANPLYDIDLAVERIKAARAAADATGIAWTLTARCEIFYVKPENAYAEAVKRANLYAEAGADCLFLPSLGTAELIGNLVKDIPAPLSVVAEWDGPAFTVRQLEDLGVRRISTGGSLTRACFGVLQKAASALAGEGTFGYLEDAISDAGMSAFFRETE